MLTAHKVYSRVIDFRLLNEADRFVTLATDRVGEPLCFRLPGRLCGTIRRESPALSDLINQAKETFTKLAWSRPKNMTSSAMATTILSVIWTRSRLSVLEISSSWLLDAILSSRTSRLTSLLPFTNLQKSSSDTVLIIADEVISCHTRCSEIPL